MVSFVAMDVNDEDSLELVLSHMDNALQYGETVEPRLMDDEDEEDEEGGGGAGGDGDIMGGGGPQNIEALSEAFGRGNSTMGGLSSIAEESKG